MDGQKRIFTILSIEGGGIRGIVAARLLQEIEERTGQPISALFDMVGGPSTGAIIGGNLLTPDPNDPTKPKFTAKDVLETYKTSAAKIFPEIPFRQLQRLKMSCLYDPKMLEEALKESFGETKVGDALSSLFIPAIDLERFKPIWINHVKGETNDWSEMLLRDAVRGATAAPTFFPAKTLEKTKTDGTKETHPLIDGAFFGGNVMRHMMAQAKQMAPDAEIIVVHAGAGLFEGSIHADEFNKLGVYGLTSKANGAMLMAFILEMSVIDALNSLKDEIGDNLFEFNGGLSPTDPDSPTPSIDDARPINIERLEKLAEKIIKAQDKELDRLCELLLTRQARVEHTLRSEQAFEQLKEKMAAAKTTKELMRTYLRINYFKEGMDLPSVRAQERLPENVTLKELTSQLSEFHKDEIDRVYPKLLRQMQQKMLKSSSITPDANKAFTPSATNDNDTPTVQIDAKKNDTFKPE